MRVLWRMILTNAERASQNGFQGESESAEVRGVGAYYGHLIYDRHFCGRNHFGRRAGAGALAWQAGRLP